MRAGARDGKAKGDEGRQGVKQDARKASHPEILANTRFHYHVYWPPIHSGKESELEN